MIARSVGRAGQNRAAGGEMELFISPVAYLFALRVCGRAGVCGDGRGTKQQQLAATKLILLLLLKGARV